MGFEIVRVPRGDARTLDAIFRLRVVAWSADGLVLLDMRDGRWSDPHDEHALHWAVVDAGRVVAAARMCVHERLRDVPEAYHFGSELTARARIASLNRLVVLPEARGTGLPVLFDEARLETAVALKCRTVVAWTPKAKRRAELVAQGFEVVGSGDLTASQHLPPIVVLRLDFESDGRPRRMP